MNNSSHSLCPIRRSRRRYVVGLRYQRVTMFRCSYELNEIRMARRHRIIVYSRCGCERSSKALWTAAYLQDLEYGSRVHSLVWSRLSNAPKAACGGSACVYLLLKSSTSHSGTDCVGDVSSPCTFRDQSTPMPLYASGLRLSSQVSVSQASMMSVAPSCSKVVSFDGLQTNIIDICQIMAETTAWHA